MKLILMIAAVLLAGAAMLADAAGDAATLAPPCVSQA